MPRGRPRARADALPPPPKAPRTAPMPAAEVGHLVSQPEPGRYVSTFVFQQDGVLHMRSSGTVSRREFNTHYMRHREWVDMWWREGKIPWEAVEWTG